MGTIWVGDGAETNDNPKGNNLPQLRVGDGPRTVPFSSPAFADPYNYSVNNDDGKGNLPQRKRLRLTNYDYSQGGGYFITINVNDKVPLLGKMDGQNVILNEVGGMVQQVWNEQPEHYPGVMVDALVVMPNHIHGIIVLTDPKFTTSNHGLVRGPAPTQRSIEIPVLMRHFKAMTTNRYYEIKANYPRSKLPEKLWQRSYYERVIRSDSDLEEKREYIETNPLRRFLKSNE